MRNADSPFGHFCLFKKGNMSDTEPSRISDYHNGVMSSILSKWY